MASIFDEDLRLDHSSLASSVAEVLAGWIIGGQLPAGAHLSENDLAERLGVSRSPVREALLKLRAEGLVDIVPRQGAYVAQTSVKDANDLYNTRLLLEPRCSMLASQHLDADDRQALSLIYEDLRAATEARDHGQWLHDNVRYHQQLVKRCPNQVLASVTESLWSRCDRYWRLLIAERPNHIRESMHLHAALHEAAIAGDCHDVEISVTELLIYARDQLLDYLRHIDREDN